MFTCPHVAHRALLSTGSLRRHAPLQWGKRRPLNCGEGCLLRSVL